MCYLTSFHHRLSLLNVYMRVQAVLQSVISVWLSPQVPHRAAPERASVALQKAAVDLQKKNDTYQLLSDDDDDVEPLQVQPKVIITLVTSTRYGCCIHYTVRSLLLLLHLHAMAAVSITL